MEKPRTKNQELKTLLWCREEFSPVELALLEKTRKYSKYVSWIPWLRMIAVCNSIAMKNADDDSDIDLFILTDPRRMWFVRFLITLIFQFLGVRRHGQKTRHRFCLSFFATTRAMDFSAIALKSVHSSKLWILDWKEEFTELHTKNQALKTIYDPYLAYWCETLVPIVDQGEAYVQFQSANAHWIGGGVLSVECWVLSWKEYIDQSRTKNQALGTIIDSLIRSLWQPLTLRTWRKLWRPWWVIISDDMLKFHPRDKRGEIVERLRE